MKICGDVDYYYYHSFIRNSYQSYMLSKMSTVFGIFIYLFFPLVLFRCHFFSLLFIDAQCRNVPWTKKTIRRTVSNNNEYLSDFIFFFHSSTSTNVFTLLELFLVLRIVYNPNPFNGINGPGNLPTCATKWYDYYY